MEEQLISYKTAELAKEKGFDEKCPAMYCDEILEVFLNDELNEIRNSKWDDSRFVAAPTQSLLQKWLREKHNLHIIIAYSEKTNKYDVLWSSDGGSFDSSWDSYEEALEEGLYKSLKSI